MSGDISLGVNSDTICFLIGKARAFHAKEEVVLPEAPLSPANDWAMQVLADHQDDPSYAEFSSTIDDLEPDQQIAIVALMWVGRGDYSVDEWNEALSAAADARTARTADYLIGTPLVADYLQEGLSQFGISCTS